MLNAAGNRRDFFRATLGRLGREVAERAEQRVVIERYFRPPGALDEVSFLSLCTRCDLCAEVCPAQAILKAPPAAGLAAATEGWAADETARLAAPEEQCTTRNAKAGTQPAARNERWWPGAGEGAGGTAGC